MTTVAQALGAARKAGLDKLDADLLLLAAQGVARDHLDAARSWLLSHDTDTVDQPVRERYQQWVQRRAAGEPLAYIVGAKEFYGLALAVDSRVLVPRPDTETLVDWSLQQLALQSRSQADRPARLLDLGTGSGAIALAVAQVNADRLGLQVRMVLGRWFDPIDGRYSCIVSNPPYVAEGDPHLDALTHEPAQALVSGPDGLRDIRLIVAGAPNHLEAGGWLLLEHGFDQGPAVQALLDAAGFQDLARRDDLAGHWRCSGGRWTGKPREG